MPQMNLSNLRIFLIFILIIFNSFQNSAIVKGQEHSPRRISALENVRSFAVSPCEHHYVYSMYISERTVLYESIIEDGVWTELTPIDTINNFNGGNSNIGGPSFNYNGTILYYHANFPDGLGGYDIYY